MAIKTQTKEDLTMGDHSQATLDDFQKLLLSVPLESTKYSFMSMFLDRVLNLTNESDILNTSIPAIKTKKKVIEILPQIAVPPDLWTKNDITIKNIKVKKVLLRNVNALLYQFLEALNNEELFLIDEQAVMEYEKKVIDYKLLDFTCTEEQEPKFDSLKEDEEDDFEDAQSPSLVLPTTNNSDAVSVSTAPSRPASAISTKSSHRLSSFSRELMGGRRKKSQLILNPQLILSPQLILNPQFTLNPQLIQNAKPITNSEEGKDSDHFLTPPESPVLPAPVTPTQHKSSQLNTLLSKSRIYKQIQKRRELSALVNSSSSVNNSSVTSQRHNSASYEPQESFTFSHRRASQNTVSQKVENQKDKYEYYVQTRALADIIKLLVGFIGKSGSRANLKRVMEFIKNSIFKFIVVDIAQMIVQKGNSRAAIGGFKT